MAQTVGMKLALEGEAQYKAGLQQIQQKSKELAAEMKAVVSAGAGQEKQMEVLSRQISNQRGLIDQLTKKYESQKKGIEDTKKAIEDAKKAYGENSTEVQKLETQLTKQETALSKTKTQINNETDALNKMEKAETDASNETEDLGNETEKAGEKAKKAGNDGFTVFKGIVADLAASAIKSTIGTLKAFGEAVIDLGKQSISGYAEMEQLVGGVEKLFGDDMRTVIDNANNAFMTAGMDANSYMETVTGFSASLISSLGGDTKAAAQIADQAIADMSDNANTFGTDMESIQNAYQGFAKGQYNMLDNLKLGYGGTKTEMQRLVKDAEKLNKSFKAQRDASGELELAYSDIIEAIHIVQTDMNITGTTAREASKTIEGSIASTKAAWKNLINSLGDSNADIKGLARNVVDSAMNVAKNVMPIIENLVKSIPSVLSSLLKTIKSSGIIQSVISSVKEIFGELVRALPDIIGTLFDAAAELVANIDIKALVKSAFDMFNSIIKSIIPRLPELLTQLVTGIIEALPSLFVGVGETIYNIFNGLFGGYSQFDEMKDILDRQSEAWDSVTSAMGSTVGQIEADAGTWQSQWDMLKQITDEDGKVKDGYHGIAQVLVDELNQELGTNISLVKGQISDYKTLQNEIDKLIEKKRAELILQAEEEAYAEALKMRPELVQAVTDAEAGLKAAQDELTAAQREYDGLVQSGGDLTMVNARIDNAKRGLSDMQMALDEATSNLAENTALQTQYMNDYTAVMSGDYNALGTVVRNYTGNTKDDLISYGKTLQSQLQQDQINLDAWEAELASNYSEQAATQVQYYRDRISTDKQNIDAINKLIEQGGKDFSAGYVNGMLSKGSEVDQTAKDIANKAINGVKNTQQSQSPSRVTNTLGQNFGQGYANGISSQSGSVLSKASSLARSASNSLSSASGSAYSAGQNTGSGFASGLGSMAGMVWNAARNIASNALSSIKSFLGINSPSKETMWLGEMLGEGLALGIKDSTKEAVSAMQGMAGEVLSVGFRANSPVVTGRPASGISNSYSMPITVYGAPGQDVNELAEIVIDKMQMQIIGSEAVYA